MTVNSAFEAPRPADLLHRVRAAFVGYRARYAAYNQIWNELSSLSDAELNDVGIHRSQIETVARAAARQA